MFVIYFGSIVIIIIINVIVVVVIIIIIKEYQEQVEVSGNCFGTKRFSF